MQRNAVGAVVRHTAVVVIAISAGMLAGFPTAADVGAHPRGHSIYMTAVEFRGSTSTDKLAPPSIDPSKLSQGYTYKAPGKADPLAPRRWEVGRFQFRPSFVTAYLDDSFILAVFIADVDHHDAQLTDPDVEGVIAKATWDRARHYTKFFQVDKVGDYHLECGIHRPSMTATIRVLPH